MTTDVELRTLERAFAATPTPAAGHALRRALHRAGRDVGFRVGDVIDWCGLAETVAAVDGDVLWLHDGKLGAVYYAAPRKKAVLRELAPPGYAQVPLMVAPLRLRVSGDPQPRARFRGAPSCWDVMLTCGHVVVALSWASAVRTQKRCKRCQQLGLDGAAFGCDALSLSAADLRRLRLSQRRTRPFAR